MTEGSANANGVFSWQRSNQIGNGSGIDYDNAWCSYDTDRQMSSYGPRSHNELRPKSKFYNLLIYAGYPA